MSIIRSGEQAYYQFEQFNSPGVVHGIFTRLGGVSRSPWDSLNLGGTVGDDPLSVQENLRRLVAAVGFRVPQLAQVKQVHSDRVIPVDGPGDTLQEADGMVTARPGVLLLMRFADCVPILFWDPEHKAVGIAHAGWQGTIDGVAYQAVKAMERQFGSRPGKILAGIGPSIGPDHYPIGPDVETLAQKAFEGETQDVLLRDEKGTRFDLWRANWIHLRNAGVRNIILSGICTGCNLQHWYSHRAERGQTGRFAAVIGLM